ncbi:MAG: Prolyl oligopeptidase family protein, partial [Verrucomicrobiaceae bacterium]|nr:Prolyl oligopeptidase family protein [Verrucomicrobiaceae bacterium]
MNHAFRLPALLCIAATAFADGPADNSAVSVRPVPPPGVEVPAADRTNLTAVLQKLRAAIDEAAKAQAKNPKLEDLLPDVEVYYKATDWALRYNELFNVKEVRTALEQLAEGQARAEQLKAGNTPWTRQTGFVVRGYRSKVDGSVQPYGMVVPENGFDGPKRLDIWCHGRFEGTTELGFIQQRRTSAGSISPANTLVLHPFGRYSCGNKFAGEIDTLEAIEHAKKFY